MERKSTRTVTEEWEMRGRAVVQQKAFFGAFSEVIFRQHILRSTMLRERKEQRERLWVSLLELYHKAWSPGSPLSAGPAYCASAEEPCFISLCSSSTLTSKLINSRLLFPPLGYEGVSIKSSPSSVLDVSLLGTTAHKRLRPYHTHLGLWLPLALIDLCAVPPMWPSDGTES